MAFRRHYISKFSEGACPQTSLVWSAFGAWYVRVHLQNLTLRPWFTFPWKEWASLDGTGILRHVILRRCNQFLHLDKANCPPSSSVGNFSQTFYIYITEYLTVIAPAKPRVLSTFEFSCVFCFLFCFYLFVGFDCILFLCSFVMHDIFFGGLAVRNWESVKLNTTMSIQAGRHSQPENITIDTYCTFKGDSFIQTIWRFLLTKID